MKPWIVYLSGPISKDPDYKEHFDKAEKILRSASWRGVYVINPAVRHPTGLSNAEYMALSFAEIDACHDVALLPGWDESDGASLEQAYANYTGKPSFQMADRFPEFYREEGDG